MNKIKDILNRQMNISAPTQIVKGTNDIAQCIDIILTTIPGSDPLRPEFGSNIFQYLDKPLDSVRAKIIYAASEAIGRWEKRIEATRCTVSRDGIARAIIRIEGTVVASAGQITTITKIV